MNEENIESPDLIWSCFINWLNTLEKVGDFDRTDELNGSEKLKQK